MSRRFETIGVGSEGLSASVAQDRKVLAIFRVFHEMGTDLVVGAYAIDEVGANTTVGVGQSRRRRPRRNCSRPLGCTVTSTRSTPPSPRPRCGSPAPSRW